VSRKRIDVFRRDPVLRSILPALKGGPPAYLVGGALRDAARGAWPPPLPDYDIAVAGPAGPLARKISRRLRGSCFVLHEATQVYRVSAESAQVDIAQIQGGGIAEDLARRDFTVNAMALPLPPGPGGLLDPFNGLADIRRSRLRATSPRVLDEDPLRVLRAFRLGAALGMRIDPDTFKLLRRAKAGLNSCAAERVRAELMGVLSAPDSAAWVRRMDEAGVLTEILPELNPSRRCAEVYYGKGGVLKHSIAVLERMDLLLADLEGCLPKLGLAVRGVIEKMPGGLEVHAALLRLGALLHDVSKPECARRIQGRLRFFEHESRGARSAQRIMKRLRFSREETDFAATLVLHHLRPGNLAANRVITDKAVFRFFRDLGERGVSLLLLCWADHSSYLPVRSLRRILPLTMEDPQTFDPKGIRSEQTRKSLYHLQVIGLLLDRYFNQPETSRPARLLDGKEVMEALGIPSGPAVGRALRALQEAQAEGEVRTKAQALRFLARLTRKE